jgi:hypothetical protein
MEAVRVFDSSLIGHYRQRSLRALLATTMALVFVLPSSAQETTNAAPLR